MRDLRCQASNWHLRALIFAPTEFCRDTALGLFTGLNISVINVTFKKALRALELEMSDHQYCYIFSTFSTVLDDLGQPDFGCTSSIFDLEECLRII